MKIKTIQLSKIVDTSNPKNIIAEVKRIFLYNYQGKPFTKINKAYKMIKDLFEGNFKGYRECNTEYHNLSHTLDALLSVVRLIDGYNITNKPLPYMLSINLLLAALFHDTGYIQEKSDKIGTGAKYTKTHVERSVLFIKKHVNEFRISGEDLDIIAKIVSCTGLNVDIDNMCFSTKAEKVAGSILGTADLLGQMADRAYLEKLIFLYKEFKEAGIMGFDTEFDIIRKTVDFYEMTRGKFDKDYMKVYRYARSHFRERYNINHNLYMEAIKRHMEYLKKIIEDHTTNFRYKLKRFKTVDKRCLQII